MSTSRRAISQTDWDARMNEAKISKRDLNRIVLDYLILEGYQSAAESFAEEAAHDLPTNAAQQVENANIESRVQIREAVERGDIQTAIEMCNDLDPEILETHPALHFHLLTQSLIELIREGRTAEALTFARAHLAPRAERNEEFLKELESVMCLLVYSATPTGAKGKEQTGNSKKSVEINAPQSLLDLLSMQHRSLTASELNDALLSSMSLGGPRREPRLAGLMRLCFWGERVLDSHGIDFPRLTIPKGEGAGLDSSQSEAAKESK